MFIMNLVLELRPGLMPEQNKLSNFVDDLFSSGILPRPVLEKFC